MNRTATYHISDILDIQALNDLFQRYSDITGMVTALLDLEGNVLIATNWQDSCTLFHRKNPLTAARCHESDTALAGALEEGKEYNVYQCRNGLVDVATPVRIGGEHVANLFTGQFFFEKPNLAEFAARAEKIGFDKEKYLDAINRVPVYDQDSITEHLKFLVQLAEMVGGMGAANLRAQRLNEELELHKQSLEVQVAARTEELEQSLVKAEEANRAKSRFLANMSHELRTPLNAILGFSQIMEGLEHNGKKKDYLRSINVAGKGLLKLINSVLDLARIESGKMSVQPAPMSLRNLAHELETVFSQQLAAKDMGLQIEIDPNIPDVIEFDEVKLREILMNLVGNAIKFTVDGSIKVHLKAHSAIKNKTFDLSISVQDSGIGISEADQKLIFEAFTQATNQKISEYGGTGLGLALSRQFTELLGGTLDLKSTQGSGSCFTCHFKDVKVLKAQQFEEEKSAAAVLDETNFAHAKVLIVDDNAMNRDLLVSFLDFWDFDVEEVTNGAEALEAAKSSPPDVILMDMKMPVMDGFEASRRLKDDPATKNIPIIAVTASVMAGDNEDRVREHTDAYVRKPVEIPKLVAELSRFIPQKSDDEIAGNRKSA